MKPILAFFLLVSSAFAEAHDVSGTIEVMLKGDKKKRDLSSVVVYLDSEQAGAKVPAEVLKQQFSMATRYKQFAPRVLGVPAGARVNFPNEDSIVHNIFSVSRPNEFDLGLFKGGASKTQSFEHPGIVKVFCNVHPQMTATIVVSASPYFTVADETGKFRLANVASGTYLLRAYSDEGQSSQKITVGEAPLQLRVTIDGKNYKKIRHKNKFGQDYPSEDERY